MKSVQEIKQNLAQYTGTLAYYQITDNMVATDGVIYLTKATDCYWLIGDICLLSEKLKDMVKYENSYFMEWIFNVNDNMGTLQCFIDGSKTPDYEEIYEYTDFPLDSITLYVIDNVILLPSEY